MMSPKKLFVLLIQKSCSLVKAFFLSYLSLFECIEAFLKGQLIFQNTQNLGGKFLGKLPAFLKNLIC